MSRSTRGPLFVLGASVCLLAASPLARADELRVPEQYRTLRRAARVAKPGDVIVLARGRHSGKATLRVPRVSVVGAPGARLAGGRLVVLADDVTIQSLSLTNVRVRVEGDGFTSERNEFRAAARKVPVLEVQGTGARVFGNQFDFDAGRRSSDAFAIEIAGESAVVVSNWVGHARNSVRIAGDSSFVSGNNVTAQASGLQVFGDDARVQSNRLSGGDSETPLMTIEGNRASVASNSLLGAVEVTGDDADLRDNGVQGAMDGVTVSGDGAKLIDNSIAASVRGIAIRGNAAQVRRTQISTTGVGIEVVGDQALVEKNTLGESGSVGVSVIGDEGLVRGNVVSQADSVGISVVGGGVQVRNNLLTARATMAIAVRGDGAVVIGNTASDSAVGISVTGDGFTVSSNDLLGTGVESEPDPIHSSGYGRNENQPMVDPVAQSDAPVSNLPAMIIDATDSLGMGGVVSGNTVVHDAGEGMSVHGDRVVVRDNQVTTRPGGSLRGIVVAGDHNVVDSNLNDVKGGLGGLLVTGDGSEVCHNTVSGRAEAGILVTGADNHLLQNSVTGAIRDGIRIEGEGNVVEGCSATGCGTSGLSNMGQNSSVTGSSFHGNGFSDVQNTGTFGVFQGNTYGVLLEGPVETSPPQNPSPQGPFFPGSSQGSGTNTR